MSPKRIPSRENQGAFFADPANHAGAMALGQGEVEIEGGFFPDNRDLTPPIEAPIISSEAAEVIERHKAERYALDCLARENRSRGNVEGKTNLANRINQGVYAKPSDEESSFEDLGRQIDKSSSARDGLKLASKGALARACGTEIYTKIEFKTDAEGREVLRNGKKVVKAASIATKDPGKQAELDAAYRKFRMIYAGTRNAGRRDARRKELKNQLSE